jgi:hypothetical protein
MEFIDAVENAAAEMATQHFMISRNLFSAFFEDEMCLCLFQLGAGKACVWRPDSMRCCAIVYTCSSLQVACNSAASTISWL